MAKKPKTSITRKPPTRKPNSTDSVRGKSSRVTGVKTEGRSVWRGRDYTTTINRSFDTPEDFLNAWVEYFKHVDENPWLIVDVVKSGKEAGMLVDKPAKVPYSIVGFQAHNNLGIDYIGDLRKRYNDPKCQIKDASAFTRILSWAESVIKTDKINGATVGVFNANIIARELELVDKQAVDHSGIPDKTITQVEIIKTTLKDGK